MKKKNDKQLEHIYAIWLYTYGGATDVVSLEDYIKEYDSDWYGDIDTYSNKVCPCVMCFEENIDG